MNGKICTNRSRHWFFNDVHWTTSTRIFSGILNGALFNSGNSRWNTNHHSWFAPTTSCDALNEIAQHFFAHVEVGNDSIFQWTNHFNMFRSTSKHSLCFPTDCNRLSVAHIDSNHRGLIQNNSLTAHVHQGVGGAEVDCNVTPHRQRIIPIHKEISLSWRGNVNSAEMLTTRALEGGKEDSELACG